MLTKTATKRIERARKHPYHGIFYEKPGKHRTDDWVTLRASDFDALTRT